MGLGKKLGQKNRDTDSQLQAARNPVAQGGYNNQNIPVLQPAPQLTSNDMNDIREATCTAQQETSAAMEQFHAQGKRTNLARPNVPRSSSNPPEINSMIVDKMWRIVCLKDLHSFYTQHRLQQLVDRACMHDYSILKREWEIPTLDMATDLAVLGLYDIVLYVDDSGSMNTSEPNEGMTRWQLLKEVIKTIAFWGSLMDEDGICVRFFNSILEGNNIANSSDVENLVNKASPGGVTPMGESLKTKIYDQMVGPIMQKNDLDRPVLVITITDGEPYNVYFPYKNNDSRYWDNEDRVAYEKNKAKAKETVIDTIKFLRSSCALSKYGENAMAFSFSQVGTDKAASNWLGEIDVHPTVGHVIDCTSEYSMEREECGPEFTESAWLIKLMIGAVDPTYDQADENPAQNQHLPQQGYPPPPSYNQQLNYILQ